MAAHLNSNTPYGSNTSYKLYIDCQSKLKDDPETKDWLELTRRFEHTSPDYAIYEGLLDKKRSIVAKIAFNNLNQEFQNGVRLERELNMPTFLPFFCKFECLDDKGTLNYSKRYLCKKTGEQIFVILMPYIDGGQIDKWIWTRRNFDSLKLVMKHMIYSTLYAAATIGFVQGDLHVGNILMKRTRRKEISYGDFGTLEVDGLIPVIMDYDKSFFSLENAHLVYKDLARIFTICSTELLLVLDTSRIQSALYKLLSAGVLPSPKVCRELCTLVDSITIRFAKSEIPVMPKFGNR